MGRYSKPVSKAEKPSVKALLEHYGAGYVPEAGRGWANMRCPFHSDSSASASVNTAAECFRCHSCNFGGDSYALVEWREGTRTFPDTIAQAESILGVSLGRVQGAAKRGRRRAGIFEPDARPVRGQASIFQARVR